MATPISSKTHLQRGRRAAAGRRQASCLGQAGEWFWFCLSLLLFLVLGPFSAPVVLIVIFRLGLAEPACREPESIPSL